MSAQATPEEIAFVVADAQTWPDAYVARRVVLHLAGEVAALRRHVEERRVVVPELLDAGDVWQDAAFLGKEYSAGLRDGYDIARKRIRPLSPGEVVATPPPDVVKVHDANEEPTESGWYECWATDDRWSGEMRYRAWGNGLWWIPLSDGWIPAPAQDGIYRWRGPVADVNGPAPHEAARYLRSGEAGKEEVAK